jgi:hypothetical protein
VSLSPAVFAGISRRFGPDVPGGNLEAASAEESPPARRLTDEVDHFRIATIRPETADSPRDLLDRCLWPRTGTCPTTRRPAARTGHR